MTKAASVLKLNGGRPIVRALGGVAPITQHSGKAHLVVIGRACDPRLRDPLLKAPLAAVRHHERFAEQYRRLRAASHGQARALPGVAERLLGIVDAKLRTSELYKSAAPAIA